MADKGKGKGKGLEHQEKAGVRAWQSGGGWRGDGYGAQYGAIYFHKGGHSKGKGKSKGGGFAGPYGGGYHDQALSLGPALEDDYYSFHLEHVIPHTVEETSNFFDVLGDSLDLIIENRRLGVVLAAPLTRNRRK